MTSHSTRALPSSARLRSSFSSLSHAVHAQQSSAVDPDASAVNEQTLLQQFRASKGGIDIPNETRARADPARRTDLGLLPRGDAALDRRARHPRHCSRCWRPPISCSAGCASRPGAPGARCRASTASSASRIG